MSSSIGNARLALNYARLVRNLAREKQLPPRTVYKVLSAGSMAEDTALRQVAEQTLRHLLALGDQSHLAVSPREHDLELNLTQSNDTVRNLQRALAELQRDIDEINTRLEQANHDNQGLSAKMAGIQSELGEKLEELATLNSQLEYYKSNFERADHSNAGLRSKAEQLRGLMDEQTDKILHYDTFLREVLLKAGLGFDENDDPLTIATSQVHAMEQRFLTQQRISQGLRVQNRQLLTHLGKVRRGEKFPRRHFWQRLSRRFKAPFIEGDYILEAGNDRAEHRYKDRYIDLYAFTDKGPRESNEDTLAVLKSIDGSYYLGVLDGAGGQGYGDEASRMAGNQIIQNILGTMNLASVLQEEKLTDVEVKNILIQALNEGHNAVVERFSKPEYAEAIEKQGFPCSTAMLARYNPHDNSIHFAWAGDSELRIYARGSLLGRSDPHRSETQKNVITRGLGHRHNSEPEVANKFTLPKKGYVIIGTDGLWDVPNIDAHVDQILQKYSSPRAVAKKLKEIALEKSKDNITVIVLKIRSS